MFIGMKQLKFRLRSTPTTADAAEKADVKQRTRECDSVARKVAPNI